MEKKTTLKIPEAYLPLVEDIRLLAMDEANPNRTTIKQQKEIWHSLQKYGWTYPILANKDGILVDGEQRSEICKQHQEFYAPVLRLPVTDVDRRMLRQILNKLKGKHDKELDAAEYVRILQQGEGDDLKLLLESVGESLPEELSGEKKSPSMIPDSYELLIECRNEAEQQQYYEKLKSEGYRVRVLNL